jgi:homoserine dehydrogenase
MQEVNVGIVGLGNVGSSALAILAENGDQIALKLGYRLKVVAVCSRSVNAKNIPASLGPVLKTSDWRDVVSHPDVHIVAELVGGTTVAAEIVNAAIANRKSVVTANKELMAACGPEIWDRAIQAGINLAMEASVCGGIPIHAVLREGISGDRVQALYGILNGTCNYILTEIEKRGASMEHMIEEAQRLGYAEADPSADVDGYDAASKAAILASLAFHTRITAADVHCEGIRNVTAADIAAAEGLGCVIKLLAICERTGDPESVSARVYPAMIPAAHPLAAVDGAFNAVFVEAEAAGQLMFYGQGAGGAPTASAVLGDLVAVARNRVVGGRGPRESTYASLPVRPMGSVPTRYHVSLDVADRAGVLATISGAFAAQGVSIAAVRQTSSDGAEPAVRSQARSSARLVVVTHVAPESALAATVSELAGLEIVNGVESVLRVEELGRKGVAG